MSRTTLRCFLALGISISLAAACGDDDGGDGAGGSAGNAGSNGMAGNAGGGGLGGGSGSSGAGGSGVSGSGGSMNGGTGGGTGGTGGGTGGSGVEEPVDAGDAGDASDASDDEPDSSVGSGGTGGAGGGGGAGGSGGVVSDCPLTQTGIVTANNDQELAIVQVLFDDDQIVIRNVLEAIEADAGATRQSFQSLFICNGPNNCVDVSVDDDCTEIGGGNDDGLFSGEEALCDVPGTLLEAGGELALTNDEADQVGVIVRSYLAWGVFASVPPTGGTTSLEDLAVTFWTDGARIAAPAGTENAIFATGDLEVVGGYDVCTD